MFQIVYPAYLRVFITESKVSAKPLTREETINFICGVLMEYLKHVYIYERAVAENNYEGSPLDENEYCVFLV